VLECKYQGPAKGARSPPGFPPEGSREGESGGWHLPEGSPWLGMRSAQRKVPQLYEDVPVRRADSGDGWRSSAGKVER